MRFMEEYRRKKELKRLHKTCFGLTELTDEDVHRIMAECPKVFRKLGH